MHVRTMGEDASHAAFGWSREGRRVEYGKTIVVERGLLLGEDGGALVGLSRRAGWWVNVFWKEARGMAVTLKPLLWRA